MRKCARAIVLNNDNLLVMKRFKMGREYYTLPGGRVEPNESPDQTAIREILEETTVKIANPKQVFVEEAGFPFGPQFIYLCDYVSGQPILPDNSEEAFWTIPGQNTYEPMWLATNKLSEVPFVSVLLKEALLMALSNGFPKEPYHFSSKHSLRLS